MIRTLLRLAPLALAAACAPRAALTESHGVSTRAAFQRQVANPEARAQAPRGLDSQESAIVAQTFREGLAPKGEGKDAPPLLLVTPPAQGGGAQRTLAPSVPSQR